MQLARASPKNNRRAGVVQLPWERELWHLLRTNKARRRNVLFTDDGNVFESEPFFRGRTPCIAFTLRIEIKRALAAPSSLPLPRANSAMGKCSAFRTRSITIVSAILSDAPASVCARGNGGCCALVL